TRTRHHRPAPRRRTARQRTPRRPPMSDGVQDEKGGRNEPSSEGEQRKEEALGHCPVQFDGTSGLPASQPSISRRAIVNGGGSSGVPPAISSRVNQETSSSSASATCASPEA